MIYNSNPEVLDLCKYEVNFRALLWTLVNNFKLKRMGNDYTA